MVCYHSSLYPTVSINTGQMHDSKNAVTQTFLDARSTECDGILGMRHKDIVKEVKRIGNGWKLRTPPPHDRGH